MSGRPGRVKFGNLVKHGVPFGGIKQFIFEQSVFGAELVTY